MLKPPSAQQTYSIWTVRDPAFEIPRQADETDETYEKRKAAAFARARETGDLSPILVDGAKPTLFTVRPMPSEVLRRLIDDRTNDRIGEAESAAIALRACLVSVDNFGGVEVKSTTDDRYGRIATNDVITALDQIDPVIVSELGGVLISRAVSPSPK